MLCSQLHSPCVLAGWTDSMQPHALQNLAFSSKITWSQAGHFIFGRLQIKSNSFLTEMYLMSLEKIPFAFTSPSRRLVSQRSRLRSNNLPARSCSFSSTGTSSDLIKQTDLQTFRRMIEINWSDCATVRRSASQRTARPPVSASNEQPIK